MPAEGLSDWIVSREAAIDGLAVTE
jgi:hypothetical protein